MPETFHAGPNLGRLSDVTVIHGDCIEAMAELAADSVDAIVTDPPYGLGFMGKDWDDLPPGQPWAEECLRVLKPGGHLLAFGGTRTWHRLACAVEDAGFEIRDSIAWLYGSGFPKSLDVGKAIDKKAGATREVVGSKLDLPGYHLSAHNSGGEAFGAGLSSSTYETRLTSSQVTAPATAEAEQWQGWGTALKPAFEPLVVARKPFKGNVAANVLAHGTGALNIDACRIGTEENTARPNGVSYSWRNSQPRESVGDGVGGGSPKGRWPANVVLDSEMAARLDEQSGITKSNVRVSEDKDEPGATFALGRTGVTPRGVADSGGASRFFKVAELDAPFKYCAKAPKKERPIITDETGKTHSHPTVKPLTLMRWLVRLVTPPGGVVLDPFAGSGATVEAALLEGFRVIGIERGGPEGTDGYHYLPMIQQRIVRCLTSS